jgi:hypothetical protein
MFLTELTPSGAGGVAQVVECPLQAQNHEFKLKKKKKKKNFSGGRAG